MKVLYTLMMMLMASSSSFSQETRTVLRNNVQFNVGYTLYDGFNQYSKDQKGINRLAVLGSYNGFVTETISIGVYAGLITSTRKEDSVYYWIEDDYFKETLRERRYVLGIKASTYFINTADLQVYLGAGISLGRYRGFLRYGDNYYEDIKQLTFMYDAHIGVNYYFNEHLGITGKLGYKTALIRFGLTYRY